MAGATVTTGFDVMYFAAGIGALAMQHCMAGEDIWMPFSPMLICLQQGLVAAASHPPKIEDWHAKAGAGCKATRASDNAKISTARIE
jgi:hypothetical protein